MVEANMRKDGMRRHFPCPTRTVELGGATGDSGGRRRHRHLAFGSLNILPTSADYTPRIRIMSTSRDLVMSRDLRKMLFIARV